MFHFAAVVRTHRTSSGARDTRTDNPKRFLQHVPHVPHIILALHLLLRQGHIATLVVPVGAFGQPYFHISPKSGERLPLDIEAFEALSSSYQGWALFLSAGYKCVSAAWSRVKATVCLSGRPYSQCVVHLAASLAEEDEARTCGCCPRSDFASVTLCARVCPPNHGAIFLELIHFQHQEEGVSQRSICASHIPATSGGTQHHHVFGHQQEDDHVPHRALRALLPQYCWREEGRGGGRSAGHGKYSTD